MNRSCPRCRAVLRQGSRFCVACGASLQRPTAVVAATWRQFLPALQLWLALLVLALAVAVAMRVGEPSPWYDVFGSAGTAIIVAAFAWRCRRRLWPLLARSGHGVSGWRLPLVVVALLVAFLEGYFWALRSLGVQMLTYLDDYREAGWPLWIGVVAVSPMPAIFEEIAFRGVIQQRLRVAMGRREALIVQAAMFSVLHLSPLVFVSHFVIGLVLGWLRERTRSLYPGMLLHALWNLRAVWGELGG